MKSYFNSLDSSYGVLINHLNNSTLTAALSKKPKVLVLYCHGESSSLADNITKDTNLCFESEARPTVVEYWNTARLKTALNGH